MGIERLTTVFRNTFADNTLVLLPDMSPKTLTGWDSFNHINLVLGVESEFGVTFTTDEIQGLKSVAQLVKLLNAKGQIVAWD
jgi:acyl carrier protein